MILVTVLVIECRTTREGKRRTGTALISLRMDSSDSRKRPLDGDGDGSATKRSNQGSGMIVQSSVGVFEKRVFGERSLIMVT